MLHNKLLPNSVVLNITYSYKSVGSAGQLCFTVGLVLLSRVLCPVCVNSGTLTEKAAATPGEGFLWQWQNHRTIWSPKAQV